MGVEGFVMKRRRGWDVPKEGRKGRRCPKENREIIHLFESKRSDI